MSRVQYPKCVGSASDKTVVGETYSQHLIEGSFRRSVRGESIFHLSEIHS